jgi:hypothetical protein
MDRVEAITRALEIIAHARAAVYETSPAAWEFLYRVTRYLTEQQKQAFAEALSNQPMDGRHLSSGVRLSTARH